MADVKISEATPAGPLLETDLVPIARAGTDMPLNATMADLATYVTVLASTHPPQMSDMPPTAGLAEQYSRADHVHPTDQSRAPIDSPQFKGSPTAPTMLPSDSSNAIATTKFVHDLGQSGTLRTQTPAIDDNSELVATTEYVQNQGSTQPPLMDGMATAGVSQRFSRADHTHPVDISRAAVSALPAASTTAPIMDGAVAAGTATTFARGDHVHPSDTSRYAANNPAGYVNAAGAAAAAPVQSVAARTGTITLTHADITDWAATLSPYALTTSVPAASSTTPSMDGTAAVGTGTTWARADHIHPTDASRAPLAGTVTNDNAAAGQIGEFRSAILLQASAVALMTGVDAVVVQVALTAGDWDVWGSVSFQMTNGNAVTLRAWINQAASQPSLDQLGGNVIMPVPNNVPLASLTITQLRVSAAAGVTLTLGATAAFGGTITAFGKIMARRRR